MTHDVRQLIDYVQGMIEDEDTDLHYLSQTLRHLFELAQYVQQCDVTTKQIAAMREGCPVEEDPIRKLLHKMKG